MPDSSSERAGAAALEIARRAGPGDLLLLALSLGAVSAQDSFDPPPVPLDSAIIFAPAGGLVPAALGALGPGGTCAIAGIYLTDIPSLNYDKYLFSERTLRSVTANTRGGPGSGSTSRH